MPRGSMGDSNTDIKNNTNRPLDAITQRPTENPYNQQSNATSSTQAKLTAPTNANKGVTLRGAARRKMNYRQRERKQLREIMKLQNSTRLIIPKLAFGRLLREITLRINPDITRYTVTALEALQEASELFLSQVFEDSYLLAMHRQCVTLTKADMILYRALVLHF
ncbi:histone H3.Y-like [Cochliomyia hominivorax]